LVEASKGSTVDIMRSYSVLGISNIIEDIFCNSTISAVGLRYMEM